MAGAHTLLHVDSSTTQAAITTARFLLSLSQGG
jgi:hypothetical protein